MLQHVINVIDGFHNFVIDRHIELSNNRLESIAGILRIRRPTINACWSDDGKGGAV